MNTQNTEELFNKAMESFETTLKSGAKIQEDSAKWIQEVLDNMASNEGYQEKGQEFMAKSIETATKNMEESLGLLTNNAKTSVDLMDQVLELGKSASPEEAQQKATTLWETSLGTMRKNSQAIVNANKRVVEAWTSTTKKAQATSQKGKKRTAVGAR